MRLGVIHGSGGAELSMDMELVLEAERLGYDSVWTTESYGADAVSTASWILARTDRVKVGTSIMQMTARVPTMTAMTAMSLQAMSGGRFILGIGVSGPQVVEGWHGVPFGRPIARTREYIEIVRKVLAREAPVTHSGYNYQLPYVGDGATGLGKPLRSILHGDPSLKIYTASITPAGVRTAAEIADGFFPIYMDPERFDVYEPALNEGFAAAGGGKGLANFDVAPFVNVVVGDDLEACRAPVKAQLALYVGGMGARHKNFYNDLARRMGWEAAAAEIQDLFLAGKREAAVAAVPDGLVDAVALVGSPDRIRDRLAPWKAAAKKSQIGSLLLRRPSMEGLRLLAEELL